MNTDSKPHAIRRVAFTLATGAALTALLASSVISYSPSSVSASSHREAPLISQDPSADNTDTYAFVSPDRPDTVTLIGNWIPFEVPSGGPNFYRFSDDVVYQLNVDNVGDAKSHITYQFRFRTMVKNPATFLYNTGPVTSLNDPNLNVQQLGQLIEVRDGVGTQLADNLPVSPVNVGAKSTPNFKALFNSAVRTLGTPDGDIKVFTGQTDDPFWVDLGSVFDLLSFRPQAPPIGYKGGPMKGVDGLAGYNVHSIAIQIPISRLLRGAPAGETVIGVWANSLRQSTRVLKFGGADNSGDWVQVSRLGMPLVNEAVLPLALKDAFNSLKPEQDYGLFTSGTPAGNLLQKSVLDPELQRLLKGLYGVPNPGTSRTDLLAIFLTGMKTTKPFTLVTPGGKVTVPAGTNVNKPMNVQPAEMIRLNTAPPFRPGVSGSLCSPTPDYKLGLLGGDVCGFPNGRRLQDNVTHIELLAVAGAAYTVLTDGNFNFNPALIGVLTDGVDKNDVPFSRSFPYLAMPHSGTGGTDTMDD